MLGSLRLKWTFALFLGALSLTVPLLLAVPDFAHRLETRLTTFSELDSDESLESRAAAYQTAAEDLDQNVLGRGLAVNASFRRTGLSAISSTVGRSKCS